MYACFITFFVRSSWLVLGGLAFGAASGAGDELYLSCADGSKWPISTRALLGLVASVVKDWLWAFINLAIGSKNQESSESASKPAIVGHR